MAHQSNDFRHPYDTPVSAGLRFLSEIVTWVAGPWAAATYAGWLFLPVLVVLVGLPSVFSTKNDKRTIVVATPGPVRVGIELLLYLVAMIAPWFIWSTAVSAVAVGIVVASILTGIPRFLWLMKGAPRQA